MPHEQRAANIKIKIKIKKELGPRITSEAFDSNFSGCNCYYLVA